MGAAAVTAAGGHRPAPPTPIIRPPLGPFPQPINYPVDLPFTPPPGPDLYFYRGNFCGLYMPGAPFVPGANDRNPNLMMAALLDNYPYEWQMAYLIKYANAGYSHLQRSIGHSLYYGHSLYDHIELSKRAQGDFGLFTDEWFLGGEALKEPDQDANYWKPILLPIIEQMLTEGAIDHACVGWQLDQLNNNPWGTGNALISIIAMVADNLPNEIPLYTHWMNEALAWWKTDIDPSTGENRGELWQDRYGSVRVTDRFTWWYAMQPYLTGGHHQGNTTMARTDPGLYAAKMADTLDYFAGRTDKGHMGQSFRNGVYDFKMIVMECTAQDQFDGSCSELEGDGIGYILMCQSGWGGSHLSGYGNGARRPDGSML